MDFIKGVILISERVVPETWARIVIGIAVTILIAVAVIEIVWDVFPSASSFWYTLTGITVAILVFFICVYEKAIPNSYKGTGEYTVKVVEHLVDWDEFTEKYEILDYTDNVFEIKVKK